jgi:hypothetical protein
MSLVYIDELSVGSGRYFTSFYIFPRRIKQDELGEISGSHGGEYEDDCLLGCCAV